MRVATAAQVIKVVAWVPLVTIAVAMAPSGTADGVGLLHEEWVARHEGTGGHSDHATSLAVSPDGSRLFVTGLTDEGDYQEDATTVAYDARSGQQLWVSIYAGPGDGPDGGESVDVSPDGSRVFVTGFSTGTDNPGGSWDARDMVTLAYDASTGAPLWTETFAGPDHLIDTGREVEVSSDGSRVYVTGGSRSQQRDVDFLTLAYDALTGTRLWLSRYDGPASSYDEAGMMVLDREGDDLFVSGPSQGELTDTDYATVAYRAETGEEFWSSRYNGPADGIDLPLDIEADPDASAVYVTGFGIGLGTGMDFATVRYDAQTGTQSGLARYERLSVDGAGAIAVDPRTKRVFVTGASWGGGGSQFLTLAYDAGLTRQAWLSRYGSTTRGDDGALEMMISPDGARLYVGGHGSGSMGLSNINVVAYHPGTGQQLASATYDGPVSGDEYLGGLVLSPDGSRLYVAGASQGSNQFDYVTIAYSTGSRVLLDGG